MGDKYLSERFGISGNRCYVASNPFKGRQHPGDLIILCVRWYLRYPLSYEHVTELMPERGVEVDASCIWRWVQAYRGTQSPDHADAAIWGLSELMVEKAAGEGLIEYYEGLLADKA